MASTPALAQASSTSPPGAPDTPTAPTSEPPDSTINPPPIMTTSETVLHKKHQIQSMIDILHINSCSRINLGISFGRGNADTPSDARRPSAAQYSLCRGDCAWSERSI